MPSTFKTFILALLITFSFLAVSKEANAKETILVCGSDYYKHNSSIFNKSMEIRIEGVWVKWCEHPDDIFLITADSAICNRPEARKIFPDPDTFPLLPNIKFTPQKTVIDLLRKTKTITMEINGSQKQINRVCYFK